MTGPKVPSYPQGNILSPAAVRRRPLRQANNQTPTQGIYDGEELPFGYGRSNRIEPYEHPYYRFG
jgi:hypothetical protein